MGRLISNPLGPGFEEDSYLVSIVHDTDGHVVQ